MAALVMRTPGPPGTTHAVTDKAWPGDRTVRNFAALTDARKAIRSNLVRPMISQPDVCAIDSIRSTPGINGSPGKWPSKIVLVDGILACALTVLASRSRATLPSVTCKYLSRV